MANDRPLGGNGLLQAFWFSTRWPYAASFALSMGLFVGDIFMPRNASVAIGYCLVPLVAAASRSRRFVSDITMLCTVTTWLDFFFEPKDYASWRITLDRSMVTAVLWLSLFLVLQRMADTSTLLRQRRKLKKAARDLKETARELERSNDELSNFTSTVAHDLRGPLNTIGLLAQSLVASPGIQGDLEDRESVEAIQTEIARMDDFVQSLLVYGRAGHGELKRQTCDCAAILDEVRRYLRADLHNSGAEISSGPLPVILGDPTLIAQLFQNLIENAIKYRGPTAPHIHLSATQESGGWRFCVRDNGKGVHPDDAQRIFQPFRQGDGEQSPTRGVGLGLATCRRIVERHGGTIHVESRPGEGSAFLFNIAAPSPLAHSPSPQSANAPHGGPDRQAHATTDSTSATAGEALAQL
jgi:signal transduction histidine kinase